MGPEPQPSFADVTGARTGGGGAPPLPGADTGALDYTALLADDAHATSTTGSAGSAATTATTGPGAATTTTTGTTTGTTTTTATPTTAPAPPPLRRIEDSGLEVPQKEKLDTIAQVLSPDQAARLQSLASSSELSQESIDTAYASVLEARKTPGQKDLALNLTPMRKEMVHNGGDSDPYMQTVAGAPETFQAKMNVAADGTVNGKPLGVDQLATLSKEISTVSGDAKREALRESGVSEHWIGVSSDGQKEYALAKMRQAAGTPGAHNLDFSFTVTGYEGESGTPVSHVVEGKAQLNVGADRSVNGAPLPIDRKLAEKIAFENKEWPAGTPESREKRRIEDVALDVPRSEKIATLAEVLSPDDAARMKALVDTGNVPAEQLEAAYASVLEARKTPGNKDVGFSLNTVRTETWDGGEGGAYTQTTSDPPVAFNAKMNVGADGTVNGKPLGVDQLALLSSQLSTVPGEAKDAALRDAGLSESWVQMAMPGEKEYALAKIRQAALTPGAHTLDLSYTRDTITGGESEMRSTHTEPGSITLNVGEDGKVNGKTSSIERALATTLTMERLPMVEKRQMMAQLGIPADAVDAANPNEASDLLTRVALRTQTPGEQQFDVSLGGRSYIMGLKIGPEGQIEGAGAVPKPPKPAGWKKWIGPILTIASFVFPPAAPFLQAANAALAVANGAKGLGLIAAVAGGFAGVSSIAGFAGAASTATTISQVAGAANGVYTGVKTGDWLSAVGSGASLLGMAGGEDLGGSLSTIQTVGQVAGYASRIVNGDFEGLLAEGIGRGIAANQTTTPTATQADVRRIDNQIDADNAAAAATEPAGTFRVDFSGMDVRLGESGTSTVRLGTGDDGASIANAPPDTVLPAEGPVATQADVRRIDNEIRATQRTAAEVREDFNRQFEAARHNGESTFLFDRGDGRGPQSYTTELRTEVAARIPGGSTAGYERHLRENGLRDSDAGLNSYRNSLATPNVTTPGATTLGLDNALDPGTYGTGLPDLFSTFGVPTSNVAALSADQSASATSLRDRFTQLNASENPSNRDTINVERQRTLQEATRQAAAITDPVQRDLFVRELATLAGDAAGRVSLRNRGVVADAEALAALASGDTARAIGTAAVRRGGASEWTALTSRSGTLNPVASGTLTAQNDRLLGALGTGAEFVGGLLPGIGQALSARDFNEALSAGDGLGMVIAGVGMLPGGRAVGAAADAATAGSRLVSELTGNVGRSLNGTFADGARTLHFTGETRPRGNTLVVSNIGLFEAGGQAHITTSGADMIKVKNDVVEWARQQGFERVELSYMRGGAEVNGTSAHAGESFNLVFDTATGQRIRTGSGATNAAGATTSAPVTPTVTPSGAARADGGGVANVVGRTREQDAASYFNRVGYDARVSNVEVNARFGGTEIDVDLVTPNGRYAVLVGGDAKAMRNGQLDETAVRESIDRYQRARAVATDPDGPYRNSGAGAIMAFPAGTDPRVIARFEAAIGRQNVVVFTPPR